LLQALGSAAAGKLRRVEAVIFCGIQGSGKTSFYRQRFLESHVRISLDLLRSRRREALFLRACLESRQPFVVDNTNPTAADRRRYVEQAREAGFRVVCYFFEARPRDAIARNRTRSEREAVPVVGLLGTYKRLEPPGPGEGFDALYRVRLSSAGTFETSEIVPAESARARGEAGPAE
jgi:hypothetical protein